MERYDCDLILDIMPLVKDGAASETTRRILGEHIATCESCLKVYASLPQESPRETDASAKALQSIRRKMTFSAWTIMALAAIIGGFLTMTEHMGYNVVLFPLVGAAAFLLMGKSAWKGTAVVSIGSFLLLFLRLITVWAPADWSEIWSCALFSMLYGLGYGTGVEITWLLRKAFQAPREGGVLGKIKHFCRFLPAILILAGLLWVCDSFLGNPISYAAVKAHARNYLDEEYPDLDLELGPVEFDWYSGPSYWIEVTSPTSQDTYFSMKYNRLGRFVGDGYEEMVLSGTNTFSRIDRECSREMEKYLLALEKAGYQASFYLNSDWPSIYDGVIDYPFEPEYELVIARLNVDGQYDPINMIQTYGVLELSKAVEEPTQEALKEALLEIQEIRSQVWGAVPACVDLTLYNDENSITVKGFPYKTIADRRLVVYIRTYVEQWQKFEEEYEQALQQQ